MVTCARCGVENEAGRKFCRECGERLSLTCSSCGAANQPDDKFCGECGVPLVTGASRPPVASGQPDPASSDATERRLVSVLFVDLVGFTSFSEGRDAEDVRAMLTHYFDAASDAVSRHGGTVEKFIGDAVMAVWGTPVAHEDDAERAVRSALEIVDRVHAIGQSLGLALSARAGVLTGEAVAMLGAVDQGFVTGDLVNTASRLQSAAEPDSVLVGERTVRSSSSSIAYEAVEPLTVKGKSELIPAWKAIRVLSELGGSNRGTAPEPPFRGRDEELRHMKELLHATGREGRPRLLHVSGVAGIGKSRLVWELMKYVDGLTEEVLWHQGRCPSYGDGVTFWALAEMVRTRARIADTDDLVTARTKLREALAEHVTDDDERRWIEPRLGHLLGLEGAPSGEREELFGAWRRFFERVSEQGTVVLVVEELHWADPGLMDFLESLLEWSRSSPILVLTLARPELMDRRATWGVGVRSSSTLHLDRLADDEIRTMVTGYVDGLHDEGLARLVSRAEGVPLYAVETVRMLADRGVLEQTGERYRVVGELGSELDIPETLHALVAARLDGLPDAERTLVQDAAVAGQSFTATTVCAISGRPLEEVEPLLRVLIRKEVLDQDVDPRSPERGQYVFVQSVIQEVAYSTLSKAARRTKHLACAERFAEFGEEDLAGVVASHYLEAYRAEPAAPDAEEIADRAREWLGRAGERAFTLGSHGQAFDYAVLALSLATSAAQRADLHASAARAAGDAGDLEASWLHLVAAIDAYRALGDARGEARLTTTVGRIYYGREQTQQLIGGAQSLLERLTDDDAALRSRVLSVLADEASTRGAVEESDRYSEEAIILAQRAHDDEALVAAASARAWALDALQRHFEGRVLHEGVVDLARKGDSPMAVSRALIHLGVSATEEDPRYALQVSLEGAEIAGRAGVRAHEGNALGNAAEMAVDIGEWDVAERTLDAGEPLGSGDPALQGILALTRAMLTAHRGDPPAALETLAKLDMSLREDWHMVQTRAWFFRVRSLCSYLGGDYRSAFDDSRLAIDGEPAGGNAPPALWVAVQAACALGDAERIRDALQHTPALRGRWVAAVRATASAALLALDELAAHAAIGAKDDAEVASAMRAALELWEAQDLPLDHALAVLSLAWVAPTSEVLAEPAARARTYLEGLGAVALLRMYDVAGR
jgi:class 3 adenylate cyclase